MSFPSIPPKSDSLKAALFGKSKAMNGCASSSNSNSGSDFNVFVGVNPSSFDSVHNLNSVTSIRSAAVTQPEFFAIPQLCPAAHAKLSIDSILYTVKRERQ